MTADQIVASVIFVVMFAVILSDRVHRTIAGMVGAAVMLLVGMAMGFYSQVEASSAIDLNTLGLLLGMMILVRLLGQTGFFQYLAVIVGRRFAASPGSSW